MLVELLTVKTDDGLRLDGALHRAPNSVAPSRPATAIVCLHGVGGNFYASRLQQQLTPGLLAAGIAVLWANTRGRDGFFTGSVAGRAQRLGAAYETVDDCRQDIAAWLSELRDLGFERLGLFGHSLGAVKAIYAAAHDPSPPIDFIVAASPPRLSCKAYLAAESPGFAEEMRRAQHMQQEGRGQGLIEAKFPTPLLISADTYVDKYGPAERYDVIRHIGRVACPMLITYGEQELLGGNPAFAGMPEALQSSAAADAALEIAAIAGADHFYSGTSDRLSDTVQAWLGSNRLAL